MTDQGTDARAFWENKILEWERDRYAAASGSMLERLASRASDSLRFRLSFTGQFLSRHVAGKRVVELGCGSGLLAEGLLGAGAVSYHGYDIAAGAIVRGEERARIAGIDGQARFTVSDSDSLGRVEADLVFSLGFLDWLTPAQIDHAFSLAPNADWLHAIAEKRVSPSQWAHRLYVQIAYGHRTGAYRPRYYSVDEIAVIAARHGYGPPCVYRDRRLSFGAMLASIPFD